MTLPAMASKPGSNCPITLPCLPNAKSAEPSSSNRASPKRLPSGIPTLAATNRRPWESMATPLAMLETLPAKYTWVLPPLAKVVSRIPALLKVVGKARTDWVDMHASPCESSLSRSWDGDFIGRTFNP
ncbi:hypothetical protein D3C85_1445840 [compost metagenome]